MLHDMQTCLETTHLQVKVTWFHDSPEMEVTHELCQPKSRLDEPGSTLDAFTSNFTSQVFQKLLQCPWYLGNGNYDHYIVDFNSL